MNYKKVRKHKRQARIKIAYRLTKLSIEQKRLKKELITG